MSSITIKNSNGGGISLTGGTSSNIETVDVTKKGLVQYIYNLETSSIANTGTNNIAFLTQSITPTKVGSIIEVEWDIPVTLRRNGYGYIVKLNGSLIPEFLHGNNGTETIGLYNDAAAALYNDHFKVIVPSTDLNTMTFTVDVRGTIEINTDGANSLGTIVKTIKEIIV